MERLCGWDIAQVPLMSELGTIRYRKPSAEADQMGKRYTVVRVRWARSVIVNTQRRTIEWARSVKSGHQSATGKRRCVQAVPQPLFMYMGDFAIAAGHQARERCRVLRACRPILRASGQLNRPSP